VLCQLEGQTTEAVARTLACPSGTIGTRLARARALLRRRLTRRGFDLSVLTGSRIVVAALPAALVGSSVRAALVGSVDKAVAAGAISAHVAALTKGALQTMSLTKWIPVTAAVLALGLLTGGAGLLSRRAAAVEPAQEPPAHVALCSPGREDAAGLTLRWKFEKGRSFYQEVTTETNQSMQIGGVDVTTKVMGSDVKQTQSQTFVFSWTPKERDEVGNWILTQRIEAVKMNIDIGGQHIDYDSTKAGDAQNPLGDFFKRLVSSSFAVRLDKNGKVRQVEGVDELFKKSSRTDPQMSALLKEIRGDDDISRSVESLLTALPETPVRVGDTWTRKTELNMGPIGKYDTAYRYTYEGKEGDFDKIKVESTLKYHAPAEGSGSLPFQIKKADIKSADGSGTILFDRAKGRIVCSESSLKLEGTLTISIGREEVTVVLQQLQKTTIKTTDADPLKATTPQGDDKKEVERLREENERLRRQLKAVQDALQREGKPKE
jgi:hypothetical protein